MIKKTLFLLFGSLIILSFASNVAFATDDNVADVITWEDLEEQIRRDNLSSKALEENINSIETIDYTNMYYSLRNQLNQLSTAQDFLVLTGQTENVLALSQTSTSLRTTYEDIRDGKLQRDSENVINQLRDAQNQVVLAGQSLYINILSMERSVADGNRGLQALERGLAELYLRKKFGQVSDSVIEDMQKSKADAINNLKTLQNSIASCKAQLQLLIGCEPTGKIELGALPDLSGDEDANFNYEEDLSLAKEKSSTLKNAKLSLEKAKESFEESEDSYVSGNLLGYQRDSAKYTYEAEKLNYESAVQNFEYSFNEIYRSVSSFKQIWKNKLEAVAYNERLVGIAETSYNLGRISYFQLLSARDALENAKSEALAAQSDTFSALNKYDAAIKYGIVS